MIPRRGRAFLLLSAAALAALGAACGEAPDDQGRASAWTIDAIDNKTL